MRNQSTTSKGTISPILTTGDVVLDRQVYQGDRIVPTQQGKIAPQFHDRIGGAFLLHSVIEAAVGKAKAVFGLDGMSSRVLLPELAVYTLWKSCRGGLQKEHDESAPDEKPKPVWRVGQALGYALGAQHVYPLKKAQAADGAPCVLVVDDADLGFRRHLARVAWPACVDPRHQPQPAWIILKMSNPVAQGDLWRALLAPPDDSALTTRQDLIVVVSADELRRAGAAISRGLSWERTLSELCQELHQHPQLQALLRHARHLVVNFGCVGTVWFGDPIGSAPTEEPASVKHRARLIYDPTLAEGDWKTLLADYDPKEDHKVYGHLSTFTAALAVDIQNHLEVHPGQAIDLVAAIEIGLTAVRQLRRLGHGEVAAKKTAFPVKELAGLISPKDVAKRKAITKLVAPFGYQRISATGTSLDQEWTLAALSENPATRRSLPLHGLAHRVALYGEPALQHIPHARFGALLSIDRAEIETLRSLSRMISAYENGGRQKQPLCLAAFGPPGAGKSFGIKEIASQVLGRSVPFLEFNLSQYNDSRDLIGAFHQVRDKCLQGTTPVVFWDEFDSRDYMWLQYLLAPMQDGSFQENGHTHTLGKCIFVFAGGTSCDFEHFGPAPMPEGWKASHGLNIKSAQKDPDPEVKAVADRYARMEDLQKIEAAANVDFRGKKGPDFISRLDGYIVLLRQACGGSQNPLAWWGRGRRLVASPVHWV